MTGAPGIGKTRLAMQVASTLLDHFEDGIYLVELAPVTDPDLVIPAIARALNLMETGGDAIDTMLRNYLGDKRMLLLLDNFEHVLDAGSAVAALLQASPWLKVLVTSREALHVRGERQFAVPPLEVPPNPALYTGQPFTPESLQTLAQNPCVGLLVEHARAVNQAFEITEENAADLAAICISLEGLPLAIELAASATARSPSQTRGALRQRLRPLGAGAYDLPPRQRTLRGAIEWSYSLLNEEERALFRRLGVFVAGFTLAAARAVAYSGSRLSTPNQEPQAWNQERDNSVLLPEGLESLLQKNLLRRDEARDGAPRLGMLETIREYALEQLEASGESSEIRRKHAHFYLGLAEAMEGVHAGREQPLWLEHLETEHDNLRAALTWATEPAQNEEEVIEKTEVGLRLGGALWRFWYIRGYLTEGRERLEAVLSLSPGSRVQSPESPQPTRDFGLGTRDSYRARALNGAGALARGQGDLATASSLANESLRLYRALGDKSGTADSLHNLGQVAGLRGDYSSARSLYEESLGLRRELGDKRGVAGSLNSLGYIAWIHGDVASARSLFEQSLAICREVGDKLGAADSLYNLGRVAYRQGDYASARSLFGENLVIQRESGNKRGISSTQLQLGFVAYQQGDYASARHLFEQSLAIQQELGNKVDVALLFNNLGTIAWLQGDYASARHLFEQSLAIQQELGNKEGVAYSFINLGHALQWQGEIEQAQELYVQGLRLSRELNNIYCISASLVALGAVAAEQGEGERAAMLLGAAEALLEAIGGVLEIDDRMVNERAMETIRSQLGGEPEGERAFAQAWGEGRALTMEEAIDYALGRRDEG
jgi:predicted ATPase/Tfp pilus assembly protein PilF